MLGFILMYIKKKLLILLSSDKFKMILIDTLNNHIDIPMIDEETEEEVFDAIFECITSTVKML